MLASNISSSTSTSKIKSTIIERTIIGRNTTQKRNKGFSLVEMIVVIAILVILSGLAVVGFGGLMDGAQRSARQADAMALASALNRFNAVASQERYRVTNMFTTNATGTFAVSGVQPGWAFINLASLWDPTFSFIDSGDTSVRIAHIESYGAGGGPTSFMYFSESITMSNTNWDGIINASFPNGQREEGWAFIFYDAEARTWRSSTNPADHPNAN